MLPPTHEHDAGAAARSQLPDGMVMTSVGSPLGLAVAAQKPLV